MRTSGLAVAVAILAFQVAGMVEGGSIPHDGCWCVDDSLHCYNMRRDVSGWWGELGANHTFTKCVDRYGNTSVWEDNWASPGYSAGNLGSSWVEEDLGCIKLDSLNSARAETDQAFANACVGYGTCPADNPGTECQWSYDPLKGCYCFPWQLGFRSRVQHSWVIECPVQGGGGGGGGGSDPSDFDYGPYHPDNGPYGVDDGAELWRTCIDYCTATEGSVVYFGDQVIGGSVACVNWDTECWLDWYYP